MRARGGRCSGARWHTRKRPLIIFPRARVANVPFGFFSSRERINFLPITPPGGKPHCGIVIWIGARPPPPRLCGCGLWGWGLAAPTARIGVDTLNLQFQLCLSYILLYTVLKKSPNSIPSLNWCIASFRSIFLRRCDNKLVAQYTCTQQHGIRFLCNPSAGLKSCLKS